MPKQNLVKTWLETIGLPEDVIETFEAAGIINPADLAELEVCHYPALKVTEPGDRKKLFYLVQRVKMAVNSDNDTGANEVEEKNIGDNEDGTNQSRRNTKRNQIEVDEEQYGDDGDIDYNDDGGDEDHDEGHNDADYTHNFDPEEDGNETDEASEKAQMLQYKPLLSPSSLDSSSGSNSSSEGAVPLPPPKQHLQLLTSANRSDSPSTKARTVTSPNAEFENDPNTSINFDVGSSSPFRNNKEESFLTKRSSRLKNIAIKNAQKDKRLLENLETASAPPANSSYYNNNDTHSPERSVVSVASSVSTRRGSAFGTSGRKSNKSSAIGERSKSYGRSSQYDGSSGAHRTNIEDMNGRQNKDKKSRRQTMHKSSSGSRHSVIPEESEETFDTSYDDMKEYNAGDLDDEEGSYILGATASIASPSSLRSLNGIGKSERGDVVLSGGSVRSLTSSNTSSSGIRIESSRGRNSRRQGSSHDSTTSSLSSRKAKEVETASSTLKNQKHIAVQRNASQRIKDYYSDMWKSQEDEGEKERRQTALTSNVAGLRKGNVKDIVTKVEVEDDDLSYELELDEKEDRLALEENLSHNRNKLHLDTSGRTASFDTDSVSSIGRPKSSGRKSSQRLQDTMQHHQYQDSSRSIATHSSKTSTRGDITSDSDSRRTSQRLQERQQQYQHQGYLTKQNSRKSILSGLSIDEDDQDSVMSRSVTSMTSSRSKGRKKSKRLEEKKRGGSSSDLRSSRKNSPLKLENHAELGRNLVDNERRSEANEHLDVTSSPKSVASARSTGSTRERRSKIPNPTSVGTSLRMGTKLKRLSTIPSDRAAPMSPILVTAPRKYFDDGDSISVVSSSSRKSQGKKKQSGLRTSSSSRSNHMQTRSRHRSGSGESVGSGESQPEKRNNGQSEKVSGIENENSDLNVSLHSFSSAPKSVVSTTRGQLKASRSRSLRSLPDNTGNAIASSNIKFSSNVSLSSLSRIPSSSDGSKRTKSNPRSIRGTPPRKTNSKSPSRKTNSKSRERSRINSDNSSSFASNTDSSSKFPNGIDTLQSKNVENDLSGIIMDTGKKRPTGGEAPASSGPVFVHGMPEDNSWSSQVSRLREATDQFHYETMANLTMNKNDDEEMRIRVLVRKRPMSRKEAAGKDEVDVIHPLQFDDYGRILVYQPKTRVDLTREVETLPFAFDNVFDEKANNVQIYDRTIRNLIPGFFEGRWASVFAYGQTGSGKTFTMMGSNMTGMKSGHQNNTRHDKNRGLYFLAAQDVFELSSRSEYSHLSVGASLFEIYGGKLFDLLNKRNPVKCLEDHKGKVCFPGLSEHPVSNAEQLMKVIEAGALNRSTGTTSANADSSRSHAVLQLSLRKQKGRKSNVEHGRLTFIDLAGSERGADTSQASRTTRLEGAEINTSLLALKEVIRALATGGSMTHIPFRGSKLTQVLKESFVGKNSRTVMVACVAPNMTNCEHTLNTLRYADRVKERNSETGQLAASVAAATKIQKRGQGVSLASRPLTAPPGGSDLDRTTSRASLTGGDQYAMPSSYENDISEEEEVPDEKDDLEETEWVSDFEDESNHTEEENELDEFLAPSPAPLVQDLPRSSYNSSTTEDDLLDDSYNQHKDNRGEQEKMATKKSKKEAAAPLITAHRSIMTKMLGMVKQEMTLVNCTDADRELVEEYLSELEQIQEKQLSMISTLRDALVDYYAMRPDGENDLQHGRSKVEGDDGGMMSDDTFEDLRSL